MTITSEVCNEVLRLNRLVMAAERHAELAWERGGIRTWLRRAAILIEAAESRLTALMHAQEWDYAEA